MGTYTTYAAIGARVWQQRRNRGTHIHRPQHALSNLPPELLKLQCPRCEQTFPFGDTCASCEVPLVDRGETLIVPKYSGDTRTPMKGSIYAIAIGTVAMVAPALWIAFGSVGVGSLEGVIGLGAALGFIALTAALRSLRESSRRRAAKSVTRTRRAQHTGLEITPTSALVEEASAVRVRGTLRLAIDGDEVHAWLEDEQGTARLPVSDKLRVASAKGLDELDAIAAGDVIEVVGPGHRVHTPGQDYRENDSEFTFDDDAVLDVWV